MIASRKELDEKLQADFPWLKQPEFERETPYAFVKGYTHYENYGFDEVGDGWYQLIHDLCTEIEEIYKAAGRPVTMKLDQVKSKFAQLRWYYDLPEKEIGICAEIAECVEKYKAKSITICEHCGADNAEICNEPPVFRWVTALCPPCKEERIALYESKMEERARYKKEILRQ